MRLVRLTNGSTASVDDADFERVNARDWRPAKRGNITYAVTGSSRNPLLMHRFILGSQAPALVDHENTDGLNNQRHNLRAATRQQNGWNAGLRRTNTSGYKGVSWHKKAGKWTAQVRVGGNASRYLGLHDTAELANDACIRFRADNHGAFGRNK